MASTVSALTVSVVRTGCTLVSPARRQAVVPARSASSSHNAASTAARAPPGGRMSAQFLARRACLDFRPRLLQRLRHVREVVAACSRRLPPRRGRDACRHPT